MNAVLGRVGGRLSGGALLLVFAGLFVYRPWRPCVSL